MSNINNGKRLEFNKTVPYLNSKNNDDERSTGVSGLPSLTPDGFKKLLENKIKVYCKDKENGDHMRRKPGNMLIFGAPGIGKSTIPREVVMEYNKNKERKDKIALISVNCANINPGDLVMPAPPQKKDILSFINKKTNLDKTLSDTLSDINNDQYVAVNAPQPWLPCYKPTGDPSVDKILDMAANGGLMEVSGSNFTEKTGSGGIILLDEFLRARPYIFNELMNLLLERKISGYTLGSKWFIIACSVRPCDSYVVSDNWRNVLAGAERDRWSIYHMEPEPESWKEWATKKGFDKTFMKFIFDKSPESFIDGEYTRWYRVINKDNAEDPHKPVTPRTWMRVNNNLINYKKYSSEKLKDVDYGDLVSHMTIDEVNEVIGGQFDDDFMNELLNWLEIYYKENNNNFPGLDNILNDPIEHHL